ncbi:MAG: pyruvate dehydrogenase (acetyl-transferring) E1 component subunit alpha, partial [Pseudomonadota bacterium]
MAKAPKGPKPGNAETGAGNESTPEELLEFYRQMLLIRRFEEKAGQLYGMGLIGGF